MRNENRLFSLNDEPIEFISGDSVILPYEVYKTNGEAVDLTTPGTAIRWRLFPYEYPDALKFEKTSENIDQIKVSGNNFEVYIAPSDTQGMEGLFTYQVKIIDSDGGVSKRVQGNLLIWPTWEDQNDNT